jgi:hypothetical protein
MLGVCIVGAGVGLLFLVSAIAEWEWIYSLWDVDAARAFIGEGAARWFCGIIGIAMLVMSAVFWVGR